MTLDTDTLHYIMACYIGVILLLVVLGLAK